jgi:hypothetical protein
MFHLEMRQFPHTAWRFNLTEQEIRAILLPWTLEKVVDLGERKWSPHKATLTILEGPKLELQQLSMGRGWRNAEREGANVTERVLGEVRRAAGAAQPVASSAARAASEGASLDGSLAAAAQVEALLGNDALALLEAWRAAAAASGDLRPSETLAIAEDVIARRKRS